MLLGASRPLWGPRPRLKVKHRISDPDHVAEIYELAIPACCAGARFSEARRLAAEHDTVVEPLSDHHRLHGLAVLREDELLIEQAADRCDVMDLNWHAEQTRKLLAPA